MKIGIIPIKYGDCITIEWTDSKGTPHIGILDGGTVSSYKEHLRRHLKSLSIPIDFWVISHAHQDHVGGVMRYLENVREGYPLPKCNCWITNFDIKKGVDERISDGSVAESVIQGNKVASYLSQCKNCSIINTLTTGQKIEFDALTLIIVTTPEINEEFEVERYSIAAAAGNNDYHIPLSDFNLANFEEDNNLTNAASVSAIVECEGKRLLWLSDSQPSLYVPALEELSIANPDLLTFDLATIAHHGSNGNTNMDYINMIQCSRFLITADGENTHNLPNKETMARFIMNPERDRGRKMQFLFPSENSTLKNMFKVDEENIKSALNFDIIMGCESIEL